MLESTHQSTVAHSVDHCPSWLVTALEGVQTVSDLVGLSAITLGLIIAAVKWIIVEAKSIQTNRMTPPDKWMGMRKLRMFLGNYILLGLEFMIVSDIIHSFLKPDLQSLATLGVLVLIRTMISFFLGKELEGVREEEEEYSPLPTP